VTKHLLQGAGLPTPAFFAVEQLPVPHCPIGWPVIVKPSNQDASVGVDQGSVVTSQDQLEERVAALLDTFGPPILVEQFIRGREFNIGLVEVEGELRVLPVSEILFVNKEPGYWPIVTYDAKWKPGTTDYDSTPPVHPEDLSDRLQNKLSELSRQAFRLLGCRDYARVDFRVRAGRPYILEVNPNPDFSPIAGLAGTIEWAGLSHAQVTLGFVQNALARGAAPRMQVVCGQTASGVA
jgi:D-alanine-D-alanine ligase